MRRQPSPRLERFTIVAVLGLALSTIGTAAAREDVVFQVKASGAVIVRVSINGSKPYRFALDTGSSHSVISTTVANDLALPAVAKTSLATSVGVQTQLVVSMQQMTIGDATVRNLAPSVVSTAQLHAIEADLDGIIGQDFLSAFNYTLDYRRTRLRWTVEQPADDRARLTLVRQADRWLVQLPGHGRQEPLVLVPDSGSEGFVVFERNGRTAVNLNYTTDLISVSGLAGRRVARAAIVPELRVGAVTLRNQPAVVLQRDGPSPDDADGLLPLHQFSSVSFNTQERYLMIGK